MYIELIYELNEVIKNNKSRKNINRVFFKYFTRNNYENLIGLVENWTSYKKFRHGRLKIINDCLKSRIESESGKFSSTLIIPMLIAQIDGIQREFLYKNNFEPTYESKVKCKGETKSITKQMLGNVYTHQMMNIHLLLTILF